MTCATRRGPGSSPASIVAQLPRVTQAVSTRGAIPAQLPFGPVYVLQLAMSYMNLALPSSFARMAVSVRFFQRQGVPPAAAITSGTIDSFTNTIVQAVLLVALLLFSGASLNLDIEHAGRLGHHPHRRSAARARGWR